MNQKILTDKAENILSGLTAYNEQLSAREVLSAAHNTNVDIRSVMIDPQYLDVIPDDILSEWREKFHKGAISNPNSRISYRTKHELGIPNSLQATPPHPSDSILLVGGPAGSGKSTVAKHIAAHFGLPLVDGDALHTEEAVRIMNQDESLDDEYRRNEWLPRLRAVVKNIQSEIHLPSVLVCSALSDDIRNDLQDAFSQHTTVFCYAPTNVLKERIKGRNHSFIPTEAPKFVQGQIEGLLQSQIPVQDDPNAILIDTNNGFNVTMNNALEHIKQRWES